MKRSTLLKILRAGSAPVVEAAKHEVAQIMEEAFSKGRFPTGNLYNSIGFITGRSTEYPNMQVGARVSGQSSAYWRKRRAGGGRRKSGDRYAGYHAHLVHFGTGSRATRKGMNRGSADGNPFMERAFDRVEGRVTTNLTKAIAKETERIAKQYIIPKY